MESGLIAGTLPFKVDSNYYSPTATPNSTKRTPLMNSISPIVKHLVLVGGGHSHLAVLKNLGMKPIPGLAVTLISKDIVTPYSGAMPAYIAGRIDFEEMHIDLRPLAQFAKVRLIQAELTSIDFESKRISIPGRPNIYFDAIALNIGSKPNAEAIKGAGKHALAVKPIELFLQQWQKISAAALASISNNIPYNLVFVGGGPASVELALAAQTQLLNSAGSTSSKKSMLKITLVTRSSSVLGALNTKAKRLISEVLAKRHIDVITDTKVVEFTHSKVICEDGLEIPTNSTIYATGASIEQWPILNGLQQSSDGFVEVNTHLQSTSHPFVFVAGDAASIKGYPRPKSGVYAVRQGAPLAKNLRRFLTGKSLVKYRPQKDALALINLSDSTSVAVRGEWCFHGKAIWALKHRIDSQFVAKYSQLPIMVQPVNIAKGLLTKSAELELKAHAMRCAGCGAKVASDLLTEVLQSLPRVPKEDVITAASSIEDASLIQLGDGRLLMQSIDQIKSFTSDPWLFAKIATNHCLSDIYAMGAKPHSALAVIGLPHGSKSIMRQQLNEVMQGCAETLAENDCALIGGHSSESSELQFGLCVNGFTEGAVLSKSGMQQGDVLILSKPLGTGTLLAADMRYQAKHEWIQAALESMLLSNKDAADILQSHFATSCTDITGFGLGGHLLEMLESNNAQVILELNAVPLLAGALQCLEDGILSSLHKDNSNAISSMDLTDIKASSALVQVLFDPQTSGGLLASVPSSQAESCLASLKSSGHENARIIGVVSTIDAAKPLITLRQ